MTFDHVVAMLLGIVGTLLFHLAKGMQRYGIAEFAVFVKRPWATREIEPSQSGDTADPYSTSIKKPLLYILGLLLNASLPICIWIAAMFAPASYFTSMFGLGLIVLLLYSRHVLMEKILPRGYIGAAVMVIGTVALGVEGIFREKIDMSQIDLRNLTITVALYLVVVLTLLLLTRVRSGSAVFSMFFGLFTGMAACLDPILKSVSQNMGDRAVLIPDSGLALVLFIASVLFGGVSFVVMQWGFMRMASASILVPVHNSVIISMPIFLQSLALPGFDLTLVTLFGLSLTIGGALLMQLAAGEVSPVPEKQAEDGLKNSVVCRKPKITSWISLR